MFGIFNKSEDELRQLLFRAQLVGANATAKRLELQIARLLNENNSRVDNQTAPA